VRQIAFDLLAFSLELPVRLHTLRDMRLLAVDTRVLRRIRRHDAVVVFGVLQKIFRCDAVTGGIGIAGKLAIAVEDMSRRATDFYIRSAAVKIALPAPHGMRLAPAGTSTARTFLIDWSHVFSSLFSFKSRLRPMFTGSNEPWIPGSAAGKPPSIFGLPLGQVWLERDRQTPLVFQLPLAIPEQTLVRAREISNLFFQLR